MPTRSVKKRSAVLRHSSHRQKGNPAPFRKFAIYNLIYFRNVLTFFRMLDIIGCFVCSLKSNIFAVGKYDTRRREAFGTTHAYKFISFDTNVRIDPVQLAIFGFEKDIHKRQSMAEIVVIRSS